MCVCVRVCVCVRDTIWYLYAVDELINYVCISSTASDPDDDYDEPPLEEGLMPPQLCT